MRTMFVHQTMMTSAAVLLLFLSLSIMASFARDDSKHDQNSSFRYGNICTTKRHVHLSTAKDSSSSITISFSSHLCDSMGGKKHRNGFDNDGSLYRYHSGKKSRHMRMLRGAVMIGTDPTELKLVEGHRPSRYNATTYNKRKVVDQYVSEYQHHITVDHLEPNTVYFYKCVIVMGTGGNDDVNKYEDIEADEEERMLRGVDPSFMDDNNDQFPLSEIFQFQTAPVPSKLSHAKIAVIGDLGTFKHSKQTLSVLASLVDLNGILLVGDISYANGNHRKWDEWFDMMDSFHIFTRIPLYIAAGNHDAECDLNTGALFTAYEYRFKMPQVANAIIGKATKKQDTDLNLMYKLPYDYGNSFYAFKLGPSYNIVLNSFADFEPGSNQYKFLVKELKGINREETPWITVTTHCPMYNTFTFHRQDPQPTHLKKYLEPLLVKYRVNFVLSGHLHAYMRTKNVINNSPNPVGPVHIIIGNGGRQANAPFYSEEAESWVAIRDHTTYGFGTIEYFNETTARYEWIQTGHNTPQDKGKNYLNPPKGLSDAIFVSNQYFL